MQPAMHSSASARWWCGWAEIGPLDCSVLMLLAAYAGLPLLLLLGLPAHVAAGAAATTPLAAWQGWRVWRGAWADAARWNSLGCWAVALLMGTATAELLAFLGGSIRG